MTRLRRIYLAAGALVVIAAACAPATPRSPAPPTVMPTATPSTEPASTGSSPSPAEAAVSMEAAWGAVAIRQLPLAIGSDRVFVFDNAGTPDGSWLIGASQPKGYPHTGDPSFAVLYNVATAELTTMAQLTSPASQILAAAADDRWVVWSESADAPYFYTWVVRAYDLRSGVVRELARSEEGNGQPVTGPYPNPAVSRGLAVWGQATGSMGADPSQMKNAVVREADLATGRISTLATSAGMPSIAWPWISWGVWSGGGGSMRLQNLQDGRISEIDAMPPTLALSGDSAAFNDAESTAVFLVDDVSRPSPRRIAQGQDSADHLEWVTLNTRIVAWAQTTATHVYDRVEQRVVALPMVFGRSAVYVCGPLIVWGDFDLGASGQDNPTHLMIIDTTKLPMTQPPK